MGRVVNVHSGSGGAARVVDIGMPTAVRQTMHRLCPLPVATAIDTNTGTPKPSKNVSIANGYGNAKNKTLLFTGDMSYNIVCDTDMTQMQPLEKLP